MILRRFLPAAGMTAQGYFMTLQLQPAPLIAKDEKQLAENAPQHAEDAPFHAWNKAYNASYETYDT